MTSSLKCTETLPEWTPSTLPSTLRKRHCTPDGQWAELRVLAGMLTMEWIDNEGRIIATHKGTARQPLPKVPPCQAHRIISMSDDLRCQLSLLCTLEDYGHHQYGMTRTHSEVIRAFQHSNDSAPLRVLDLGCGGGRNTLYMALKGHHVTALDHNAKSLESLTAVIREEELEKQVDIQQVDLNQYALSGKYDVMISTVVMMFLRSDTPTRLIRDMQSHTAPGGINLIVAAMSTEDYPCPMPFSFTFGKDELCGYYTDAGWSLERYNEDVGELHRKDAQGNRIKLRFATLLAKRPG